MDKLEPPDIKVREEMTNTQKKKCIYKYRNYYYIFTVKFLSCNFVLTKKLILKGGN